MVFSWDRDIPPEEAKDIIERVAKKVVDYEMEVPAILALEMATPLAFAGAEIIKMTLFPFLGLIGEDSYKVINVFKRREYLQQMIDRIKELSDKDL